MLFKEEFELDSLERSERELARRRRELGDQARRLERDRQEIAHTLPPCEEIRLRCEMRKHQEMLMSRGEVTNLRREQNSGLLLVLLLLCATASLIWWGLRLMQG